MRSFISSRVGFFSDFCSAHIVNRKTWKMAGTFHGRIKSNQFGTELNKLGYFFNKALIAVEANNMGQSTVDRLVELDYPNLYRRQRFNKEEKKVTDEYGWWTDAKTKALLIGYMQDLIRTEQLDMPDIKTIDEMITFIRATDGGMEASEGNHDDRVMSAMGAYYVLKISPFYEAKKPTKAPNKAKQFRDFRRQKIASPSARGRRWR